MVPALEEATIWRGRHTLILTTRCDQTVVGEPRELGSRGWGCRSGDTQGRLPGERRRLSPGLKAESVCEERHEPPRLLGTLSN